MGLIKIETYWNVNNSFNAKSAGAQLIKIETDWNVNNIHPNVDNPVALD